MVSTHPHTLQAAGWLAGRLAGLEEGVGGGGWVEHSIVLLPIHCWV